jgi:hypothetical protein
MDKIKGWKLTATWVGGLIGSWALFITLGLVIWEGIKWLLH